MASAGTDSFSVGLRHETPNKLTPAPPEKAKEPKSRTLTTQLAPIWRLERKYVNVPRRPGISMVPSSYYTSTNYSNIPALPFSAPSEVFSQSKSLHDTFESSLVFQRPVNNFTPYHKLETLRLKSKGSGQTQYSYLYKCPPIQSPPKIAFSESAMTSSLIDQFHLSSVTGEPPQMSVGNLCRKPTKLSINSKPVVVNSALRPSSAKVPLHPHQESKKIKSPPRAGTTSASWHHGEKGDWGQLNGEVHTLCHNCINMEMVSHMASLPNTNQGLAAAKMEGTWQTDTFQRKVSLTKAVQRLAENDVLNKHSVPQLEPTPRLISLNDIVYASCKKKSSALHSANKEVESCNPVPSGHCLNDSLSVNCINSANTCTMQVCANLSVDMISDPSTSSKAANVSTLKQESQVPLEQGNITVMATQISTIHLDKTIGIQETQVKPNGVAQDLSSLFSVLVPNDEHDGVEEELPDGMYESQEEEEEEDEDGEGGTDNPSLMGVSSTYLSTISRDCVESLDNIPANEDKITKPALTPSLFPNMTPTIYFGTINERVELLPWSQRKLLKWRMSTVTPNVVKQAIARSHFRVTKKNNDWLGCWGHHMKSPAFKAIREYQKLNHFPGSFQIGRKDRLWRNLSKMQARFGRKEFNFFPQSFVLPQDIKLLRKAWEEGGSRQKWIVKPPASARGAGIHVIHKWSQLPKKRPLLVQRYLHKPYLISESKFDLRIYVYVTSYDPLRVYLFTDGLVRFASCKYSSSMKSLGNKFMHLTNYSVNKKNADYKSNSDQTACQGHKWALKALWSYLDQQGFSSDKIWEKIKDMVIKTIIASEPYVNSFVKMYVHNPYSCHELFGFDIMLDENLKPWVLEVNISPSLHSNSQLDLNIKGQMIRDLLNLAGFVVPNKDDVSGNGCVSSNTSLGKERCRSAEMQTEERTKRAYYLSQKLPDKDVYATVLDQLTPEDIRVLVETEDELSRCGQFERVFPSPISSRYLRFFEQPRYYNILTNQWEQKYFANRERGSDFLKSLCLMEYHTGMVPHSPVWSLPRTPPPSQGDLFNGLISEEMKNSKSPIKSDVYGEERLKSLKMSPFRHSSVGLHQPELERSRLSQTISNVPESALVM